MNVRNTINTLAVGALLVLAAGAHAQNAAGAKPQQKGTVIVPGPEGKKMELGCVVDAIGKYICGGDTSKTAQKQGAAVKKEEQKPAVSVNPAYLGREGKMIAASDAYAALSQKQASKPSVKKTSSWRLPQWMIDAAVKGGPENKKMETGNIIKAFLKADKKAKQENKQK